MSSREFNQDTARAKRAARHGPVFITDRGRPSHVLLTMEAYDRLERQPDADEQPKPKSLLEALADTRPEADFDWEPPKMDGFSLKVPDFEPVGGSMSIVTTAEEWLSDPAAFQGEWQGGAHGAELCVIANRIEGPGGGPRLHRHPYPEVFVIRSGRALFTLGDRKIEAKAGEIVVAPAHTPHKFENLGPGPLETIDIHQNGSFVTEWLE